MKKLICTLLLVSAGAAVFGTDISLSAGAGGLIGGLFTRYNLDADGDLKINAKQEVDQFNWGFFAFFDATYGIFSISFQNGANDYRQPIALAGTVATLSGKGWETMLGISLLGKYPFKLNERFTVFPLLGLEYQISLSQHRTDDKGKIYDRTSDVAVGQGEMDKNGKALLLEDWNSLFINLGGGVDFQLPKNFYLRGELLYGFRLMTPYEQKNLEMMKVLTGDKNPTLGGLTSGPTLRISVGWCFYSKPFGVQ